MGRFPSRPQITTWSLLGRVPKTDEYQASDSDDYAWQERPQHQGCSNHMDSDVHNVWEEPPHWATDVKRRLVAPPGNLTRNQGPSIFRVPTNIRNCDPSAYTPQVVTIGPYHLNCLPPSDITISIQHYKSWCVRFLLSRRTHGETEACNLLYRCLGKMEELGPAIRNCYSADDVGLTNHELAELMLLDGCFIITRLLEQHTPPTPTPPPQHPPAMQRGKEPVVDDGNNIRVNIDMEEGNSETQEPLLGMLWIRKLVDFDLLMLENQISFFVLIALFKLVKSPMDVDVNLINSALKLFGDIHPIKSSNFCPRGNYLHLHHLFYTSLLPSEKIEKVVNHDHSQFSHDWLPSAIELRRAGVAFRENKEGNSFLDITFKEGVISIPRLHVDGYSNSLFRNLIAFEQCYPHTSTQITTYAIFMDCLVDTDQDVKMLGLSGILVNRMSTDQEVADLFNKLTKKVFYALDRNYLHKLFIAVNKYHQSKWHRYRAGLMRDYFSNPWAIISVVGAVILIVMTGLQTFYTMYAYYLPSKNGSP